MVEIKGRTISECWPLLVNKVLTLGRPVDVIASGDHRQTIELQEPVVVIISNPLNDMEATGSKWAGEKLEAYGRQLVNGESIEGFDYNYHDQIFKYPYKLVDKNYYSVDQIESVIEDLKIDSSSRKEIAITWEPYTHIGSSDAVPCLILCDFSLRRNALSMVVYFRSNDIYAAWPSNAYGLIKLMEYVAKKLRVEVGQFTIISNKAHIYEYDINIARFIAGVIA
jgi:thymidylate synthase